MYGGPSPYFGWTDLVIKFIALTFGSIVVGFVCGCLHSLLFKFVFFKHTEVLEGKHSKKLKIENVVILCHYNRL